MNHYSGRVCRFNSWPLAFVFACLALLAATPASTQTINQVGRAGSYAVRLRVLPPESFHGANAMMMHDGGAPAVAANGPEHPNYHLVVFIRRNDKPVEDARVAIAYRQSLWKSWKQLPVARMHEMGKGLETTHFGNNVKLDPGRYFLRVTVNGDSATFRFMLGKLALP